MQIKRLIWLFLPILGSVGLDRWTKVWATSHLMHTYPKSFWNDFFRFQYALNEGAFLSLGSNMNETVRYWVLAILPVVVLGYIFYYALTAPELTRWGQLAFGFILGGGGSNIYDRIMEGHVVDFMNMGIGTLRTGIFNIADVAIMTGLFILIFNTLIGPKQVQQPTPIASGSDQPVQPEEKELP